MKNNKRHHQGLTSVLAMIYLTVIAMLAVGFYSAIDLGANIADNEQYIKRSETSAEVGMAFARYYLTPPQLLFPAGSNNLLSTLESKLAANLPANYAPTLSSDGTKIYIPGSNGAPTYMSTDSIGGQAYIVVSNPSGQSLSAEAVGLNSHSGVVAGSPHIYRLTAINFNTNPIYSYGMVSYGEIMLNGGVTVNGTNGGVLSVTTGATKPINVNGSNSFSGDFSWTNGSIARTNITWGSLTVDGYLSSSGQFPNHVHGGVATPTKPTFDTSGFLPYVGSSNPYGGNTYTTGTYNSGAATLTNCYLSGAGTYSFNNLTTINGILYLGSGVNINFNSAGQLTINGAIVQANGSAGGTIVFDGKVVQTAISNLVGVNYPSGETALTGSAFILPNYNITFNNTVATVGSIVGGNLIFNKNTTVNGGSVLNMGTNNMTFNSTATITINTANVTPSGANFNYAATPATYSEPQYTGVLP
jgi:hypothetical protein